MEHDSPDFVPSLYESTTQEPTANKVKRKLGHKPDAFNVDEEAATTPTFCAPVVQSSDLMEADGEHSEEKQPATSSVPKEGEPLSEEDEIVNEAKMINSHPPSSPMRTSPSYEAKVTAAAILKLGSRRPVIFLKRIFSPAGGFQCEACNQNFTDVSRFIKHTQIHDEQRPLSSDEDMSNENCGNRSSSVTNSTHRDVHMDEPSFKCNMCERSFHTSHILKRHKLLHVKDGRKCRQCGVLFCRLHRHILFRPQVLPKTDLEQESSEHETPNLSGALTSENDQKKLEPNQKAEFAGITQSTKTTTAIVQIVSPSSPTAGLSSIASMSNASAPHPIILELPDPKMLDPSRPPSPIPIKSIVSSHFKTTPPNHPKDFVQPHLPVIPDLSPSLLTFSPQYLTSALLEVERNYAYILSKRSTMNACVKEQPCELPVITPPQLPQHEKIKKERTGYDLEFVL